MSERLPFSSSEELISWAMGGANVYTLMRYGCGCEATTSAFSSVAEVWWSQSLSKHESSCLLQRFPCPALHWTCYHGVLDHIDCVHLFKRLANQVGYIIVIARVARDLWQRKQTLSSGCALGLGSFTAINPRHPCYYYYVDHTVGIILCTCICWKHNGT